MTDCWFICAIAAMTNAACTERSPRTIHVLRTSRSLGRASKLKRVVPFHDSKSLAMKCCKRKIIMRHSYS